MGRVKTQIVKRTSKKLVAEHEKEFTKDFKENKTVLAKLADIPSAKLRNVIAGYITRLIKTKE
jgi:small subunit ribosomal protein S17e